LDVYAVLNILEALAESGMGALAVQEGRSWMNGKFGLQSLSEKITIVDDALHPDGLPQAFDCEGVPKRRVPIVVEGVPASPVYDRMTAAREAGRESTGHAQPYEDEDWDGPLPENLFLAPGVLSVPEMISKLDCGLYVTRFWYVNLTAPGSASVTGTTRDGAWWIEDGELAYPVENLRFDQNLLEAFRHVIGVGREPRTLAGFLENVYRVPALALESFRFIEVG
jgi:predicted Zn-dependent protease